MGGNNGHGVNENGNLIHLIPAIMIVKVLPVSVYPRSSMLKLKIDKAEIVSVKPVIVFSVPRILSYTYPD